MLQQIQKIGIIALTASLLEMGVSFVNMQTGIAGTLILPAHWSFQIEEIKGQLSQASLPTCLNCSKIPIYPALARENGWEGQVKVSLTVNPDGSISNVKLLSSSGYQVFDQAAIETAYNFQFTSSEQGIPNYSDENYF